MEKFKNIATYLKNFWEMEPKNDSVNSDSSETKTEPESGIKERKSVKTEEQIIPVETKPTIVKRKFEGIGFIFRHKLLFDIILVNSLSFLYLLNNLFPGIDIVVIFFGIFLVSMNNLVLSKNMMDGKNYDENFSAIYIVDMSMIWIFWHIYGVLSFNLSKEPQEWRLLVTGFFVSIVNILCFIVSFTKFFRKEFTKITLLFMLFLIPIIPPFQMETPQLSHMIITLIRIITFQITYSQMCMFVFYDRLNWRFFIDDNDKVSTPLKAELVLLNNTSYQNYRVIIISSWPLFVYRWLLPCWIIFFTILTIKIVEIKTRIENEYGIPSERKEKKHKKQVSDLLDHIRFSDDTPRSSKKKKKSKQSKYKNNHEEYNRLLQEIGYLNTPHGESPV